MVFIFKYSNRYHDIKSPMHQIIYQKFIQKKIHSTFFGTVVDHNDMMCDYFNRYLFDCANAQDLVLNYKQICRNIMSCMFTLNVRMQVIHHFLTPL